MRTYQDYARPRAFGRLYERAGLTVAFSLSGGLALFMVLAIAMNGRLIHEPLAGNFYAIFPHNFLAVLFGIVFLFAIVALGVGVTRFWRDISPVKGGDPRDIVSAAKARVPAVTESVSDVARLKYLGGGHGDGCNEDDDAFTLWRRRFHQLTLYGFLLCFAATCVATLYHYLFNLHAPYAFSSAPVILGSLGGVGLIFGPVGLLWLNLRRDALRADVKQNAMDRGFIMLLLLVSATGFGLLLLRDTPLHGAVARHPSRHRDGAVPDAAIWQIRPWHLPLRSAAQIQYREAHAKSAWRRRGSRSRDETLGATIELTDSFGQVIGGAVYRNWLASEGKTPIDTALCR